VACIISLPVAMNYNRRGQWTGSGGSGALEIWRFPRESFFRKVLYFLLSGVLIRNTPTNISTTRHNCNTTPIKTGRTSEAFYLLSIRTHIAQLILDLNYIDEVYTLTRASRVR
jgi:hypothetical protein